MSADNVGKGILSKGAQLHHGSFEGPEDEWKENCIRGSWKRNDWPESQKPLLHGKGYLDFLPEAMRSHWGFKQKSVSISYMS